ncbi:MAG: alpha-L-fucosidase [Clostridia bacterium]|nr:alpha-L-fucosidase [Clostridia bacterium]
MKPRKRLTRILAALAAAGILLTALSGCETKEEAVPLLDIPEIEYEAPEWFRDAKFGIFIHYGVYSVPAFGDEWYGHWMYIPNTQSYGNSDIYTHHVETYGGAKAFGYKDFIPDFLTGIKTWQNNGGADEWAELFEKAGAKYVVPVGIHHDSFALYDSGVQTTYNSKAQAGVDYIGELKAAVTARGMKFGVSNHFAENDWFFDEESGRDTDLADPAYAELYGEPGSKTRGHVEKWYAISMEIINKYQPDLIYYDFDLGNAAFNTYENANRYKMLTEYYALAGTWDGNEGVVCNYKYDAFTQKQAVLDKERSALGGINPIAWQTDTSVGAKSWGYVTDEVYRSGEEFIGALADIVSKNGNLLLNVGPKADGTFPEETLAILETIGAWLDKYGDAIYCTRPWTVYGEGDAENAGDSYVYTGKDVRFTRSKDNKSLYMTVLGTPENGKIVSKLLNKGAWDAGQIDKVCLLDGDDRTELTWEQTAEALCVTLPEGVTVAAAVEITFKNGGEIPPLALPAKNETRANGETEYRLLFDGNESGALVEVSGAGAGSVTATLDGEKDALWSVSFESGDGTRTAYAAIPQTKGTKTLRLTVTGDLSVERFVFCNVHAPGERIEAENYDLLTGNVRAEPCADGGENLGYVGEGDRAVFGAVDFGEGCKSVTVRLAGSGQRCRLRLDAPDGETLCEVGEDTGGWSSYKTVTCAIPETTGVHTVYITYDTGWSDLNINWFAFS